MTRPAHWANFGSVQGDPISFPIEFVSSSLALTCVHVSVRKRDDMCKYDTYMWGLEADIR